MSEQIEESGGQQSLEGPGLERRLTNKIGGAPPDSADLKISGAKVAWDEAEVNRGEKFSLIVDVVVTGVSIDDKIDENGYAIEDKTVRTQTVQIENWEVGTLENLERRRVQAMRETLRGGHPGEIAAALEGQEDGIAEATDDLLEHLEQAGITAVEVTTAPRSTTATLLRAGDLLIYPAGAEPRAVVDVISRKDGVVRLVVGVEEDGLELSEEEVVEVQQHVTLGSVADPEPEGS